MELDENGDIPDTCTSSSDLQRMKKRRKFISIFLLAVLGLALGVWWHLASRPELELASGPVDFDHLIAHARRCNDSYHGHEVFRREYGGHIEVGEFLESGLRV